MKQELSTTGLRVVCSAPMDGVTAQAITHVKNKPKGQKADVPNSRDPQSRVGNSSEVVTKSTANAATQTEAATEARQAHDSEIPRKS